MRSLHAIALVGVLLVGCGSPPPRAPSGDFDAYESADHPGWLQVDSGPGRFSALMPSTVIRRASGSWKQTVARSQGHSFLVSYRDDDSLGQGKNQRRAFDRIAAAYVADAAEVRTNEPFSALGLWGRKLILRDRDSNRWTSLRLLVVGTRLYQLIVLAAPGEPLPEADAAVFFQSFEPERP